MGNNLLEGSIKDHYFKYIIPSVSGTLAYGILIFIDTVFIGRGIGDKGLAALNIAIPIFSLTAFGMLLGSGGATAISIDRGQGNTKNRSKIFTLALFIGVISSFVFSLIIVCFLDEITRYLGAKEEVFLYAKDYINVISKSIIFYIIPHILTNFIKNDSNPKLPMIYLVIVSIFNIGLDYLFIMVYKWGMSGAALATSISQVIGTIVLCTHFFNKKTTLKIEISIRLKEGINFTKRIFKIGVPNFINEITLGMVIVISNGQFYKYLGNIGISAYGIMLNINLLIYLVYCGIAQGAQPILSINFGALSFKRVKETLRLGMKILIVLGILFYSVLFKFDTKIISLFNNNNEELIKIAIQGLPLFFLGALIMGINLKFGSFFQAIEYSKISSVINMCRSYIFIIIFIKVLPIYFKVPGLWLSYFFSEFFTLLLALFFYKIYYKSSLNNVENN